MHRFLLLRWGAAEEAARRGLERGRRGKCAGCGGERHHGHGGGGFGWHVVVLRVLGCLFDVQPERLALLEPEIVLGHVRLVRLVLVLLDLLLALEMVLQRDIKVKSIGALCSAKEKRTKKGGREDQRKKKKKEEDRRRQRKRKEKLIGE